MNNEIKLHILGVPMNKLGSWLITVVIINIRHFLYALGEVIVRVDDMK